MEGEENAPPVSRRQQPTRQARPTLLLDEQRVEENVDSPTRISSLLKKHANMKVEEVYLQNNYKEPLPTPLETIFESPQPTRNKVGECPEVAPLMARRKLKRLCVFGSHYQPSRTKLRNRRDRAHRMRQLRGVRVPLGKAFSEDDVQMALSCLLEEDKEELEATEELVVSLPHSPMESITQDFGSLQMDCEPSISSPAASRPTREKRHRRRSGLVVSPGSLLGAATPPSDHPTQPPSAREKKLRRRSGLVLLNAPDTPPAPQDVPGECPPPPRPRKATRTRRKRQEVSGEAEQGSRPARVVRVRSGNKRNPDTSPATAMKKQCITDPHTTNTTTATPTTSTTATPTTTPSLRGKRRTRRRTSGTHRPLYTTTPTTTDSPTNTSSPAVPLTNTSSPAVPLTNTPSPAVAVTHTPSPAVPLTHTPSPAVPLTNTPTLGLTSTSSTPSILPTTIPTPSTPAKDMPLVTASPSGDKELPTTAPGTSPTSPCTGMAALTLQCTPSPINKARKARRRSARLSLRSESHEELSNVAGSSLGTLWVAKSPTVVGTVQSGGVVEGDALSPPQQLVKRVKKERRRSNQFIPLCNVEEESFATSVSVSCTASPPANASPTRKVPFLLSPATHVSLQDTPMQLTPTGVNGEGRDAGSEAVGRMEDSTSPNISEGSSPSISPASSKPDIQNMAILEDFSDLTTPSPANVTPSEKTLADVPPFITTDTATPPCITPASATPPCITPASATLLSITPASANPPSITPNSATTPSFPRAVHGDQHVCPEEDWDSPIVQGIMTNETLIRMGRVYYGSHLSSPSPSSHTSNPHVM